MPNPSIYIYTASKENSWYSFFAIKLDCVAAFDPSREPYKDFAFELLNTQIDFINTLDCPEDDRSINLRYVCHPAPSCFKGTIDVVVIVSVPDRDRTHSREKASKIFKDVWPAITSISESYEFEPVTDEKEFMRVYNPFEVESVVEILRREDVIEARSVKRVRGFGGAIESRAKNESIYYVYPFIWGLNPIIKALNVMMSQDLPSMLSIILKPADFSSEVEALFLHQIDIVEKCKQIPGYERDQLLEAISTNLHAQLLRLGDSPFFVKIMLASAGHISKGLIDSLGVDLTEHAGSPDFVKAGNEAYVFSGGYKWHSFELDGDKEKALGDLQWLTVNTLAPSVAPDEYKKIRYLFDSTQANCAFRLPVPQIKEISGLKTRFSKNVLPPPNIPEDGVLLGYSKREGVIRNIRVPRDDRRRHMYTVGQTGTGKSTLLQNMILQDIENNDGVGVLDPHGELIDEILHRLPENRKNDVVYINFEDVERPIALNMLECKTEIEKDLCVQQLFEIFEKLYDMRTVGGPMFETYMKNSLYLLLENDESAPTLLDVQKIFADKSFRNHMISRAKNPYIVDFWKKIACEAEGEASLNNIAPYIISKLSMFIYNNTVRNIIASQRSSIDIRKIIDEGKILLVDLSKGKIGAINSYFLGMVIISKILMAALGRGNPEGKESLKDFYLYIDEFQNLATGSFITLLSEARKYRLNAILANQYLTQIPEKILESVLGNVGSIVAFRLGITDSERLEKEFYPSFTKNDITNLPNWHVCVKMLAKGEVVRPFEMKTYPAKEERYSFMKKNIIERSREFYGRDVREIEREMEERRKEFPA